MSDIDNQSADAGSTTEGLDGTTVLSGEQKQATAEPSAQQVADWKASLPDELKSAKSLQSINSVEDLVKSYVNAQSVIGKKVEDMTPEQLAAYSAKLGRPETPDGYQLELPENADENLVGWFKNTAHELGLPAEQTGKLFSAYNNMVAEQTKALEIQQQSRMIDELKTLKQEFGPEFDKRTEFANRALEEFGGKELIDVINQSGLGNNPALVKAFAKAGMMLSEGNFVEGASSGKFGVTPADASARIDTLRKDPAFMAKYNNPASAGYQEALRTMEDLYKIKAYKVS